MALYHLMLGQLLADIRWFSGNISDLHPLTVAERAQKLEAMAQRQTKISDEAEIALNNGEYQWALELADMLIALDSNNAQAKTLKLKLLISWPGFNLHLTITIFIKQLQVN